MYNSACKPKNSNSSGSTEKGGDAGSDHGGCYNGDSQSRASPNTPTETEPVEGFDYVYEIVDRTRGRRLDIGADLGSEEDIYAIPEEIEKEESSARIGYEYEAPNTGMVNDSSPDSQDTSVDEEADRSDHRWSLKGTFHRRRRGRRRGRRRSSSDTSRANTNWVQGSQRRDMNIEREVQQKQSKRSSHRTSRMNFVGTLGRRFRKGNQRQSKLTPSFAAHNNPERANSSSEPVVVLSDAENKLAGLKTLSIAEIHLLKLLLQGQGNIDSSDDGGSNANFDNQPALVQESDERNICSNREHLVRDDESHPQMPVSRKDSSDARCSSSDESTLSDFNDVYQEHIAEEWTTHQTHREQEEDEFEELCQTEGVLAAMGFTQPQPTDQPIEHEQSETSSHYHTQLQLINSNPIPSRRPDLYTRQEKLEIQKPLIKPKPPVPFKPRHLIMPSEIDV